MIPALLFAAQLVPVPPQPRPVETNIAAIRSNPRRFDGALVRLHGWVNRCDASACTVTERALNAAGGAGQSLSIAPDTKFDDTIRPLLPTYVEFDARLNATCLVSDCSGRPPVLTIVMLRGVVSPEPPPFEN